MWQVVQAAHKVPCHDCLAQPDKPAQQQHMRQRVWQQQPSGSSSQAAAAEAHHRLEGGVCDVGPHEQLGVGRDDATLDSARHHRAHACLTPNGEQESTGALQGEGGRQGGSSCCAEQRDRS